jgi:hypothetical protein
MAAKRTNYRAAADRKAATPPKDPALRVRTDPIRVTLDLSPTQHAALKAWCNLSAVDVGLPAVALAPVLRVLGDLLTKGDEEAPELQQQLKDAVLRALHRQAVEAEETRGRRR